VAVRLVDLIFMEALEEEEATVLIAAIVQIITLHKAMDVI